MVILSEQRNDKGAVMEIRIIQKNKELWSAEFDIVGNNQLLGKIWFRGSMGSIEGSFEIKYTDDYIHMTPTSVKKAVEMSEGYVQCGIFKNPYRPYLLEYNNSPGIIFHHQIKNMSYRFLNICNNPLKMYPLGFGKKGMCCPIYRGNQCIAEIHKEPIIHDDLHEFTLCFPDYSIVPALIIYACHEYVIAYYKAGVKPTKGIQKDYYKTTDKKMLSKCTNTYYLEQ